MKDYTVRVEVTLRESVQVSAETEDDAMNQAEDELRKSFGEAYKVTHVEAVDVKVEKYA